ncbi:hypothetical protein [Roseivirga thermotolerans]|uniref:Uncharacterized protein n=1 Tax=Roseivirga thermotolerans TaxID=1758176 RepID=A0ABQ3I4E8_9BACT|nr:hypothetical protein [Roseivirga thermotolerans]GHE55030.1 hypothetical protein GCM10011340_07170 [Roseivirga thermotolerans]
MSNPNDYMYLKPKRTLAFSLVLFLTLSHGMAQKSVVLPFDAYKAERTEFIEFGLLDIMVIYSYKLLQNDLYLETVKVNAQPLLGYELKSISLSKNKIDNHHYRYELSAVLTKTHLGKDIFSAPITIVGSLFVDVDDTSGFSINHEFHEIPVISKPFLAIQYIWNLHYWLVLISVLVLLARKTLLNLRHALIVVIPLIGPLVYLIKELKVLLKKEMSKLKSDKNDGV